MIFRCTIRVGEPKCSLTIDASIMKVVLLGWNSCGKYTVQ